MRRYERLTFLLASVAMASLMFASGCGGCDDDDDIDARPPADARVDADTTDAIPPDAGLDAAVSTHAGSETIVDLKVAEHPEAGQGIKTFFGWHALQDESVTKIFDDRDVTHNGCAAWVYDLEATPPQLPDVDEGHGTISVLGTTETIPDCVWLGAAESYICPTGVNGTCDTVTIGSAGSAGQFVFNDSAVTFTDALVGRYISITVDGAGPDDPWNGAFAIAGFVPANGSLVIINTDGAAQIDPVVPYGPGVGLGTGTLGAASTYQIIAGAGPVPGYGGGIADDDTVEFKLDSPVGDPIEDIDVTGLDPGDEFSMSSEMQTLMNHIVVPASDGTSADFTIGCEADVAHFDGAGPAITMSGTTATLTHNGQLANVRVGAEITIGGMTEVHNNGEFTITAVSSPDSVSYENTNANATDETFDAAGDTYAINDCGDSFGTVVAMDFNDGDVTTTLASNSDTGPTLTFTDNGGPPNDTITLVDMGAFSNTYFGDILVISGTDHFDGQYTIGPVSDLNMDGAFDAVTVLGTATAASEAFDAPTDVYMVLKKGTGLPDQDTATMVGALQCASIVDPQIVVEAEAVDALKAVQPTLIQTTYIKAALGQAANADYTNETLILVGHGYVGFTVVPKP